MHPDARALVDTLGLAPHPEGGFYRETFRSEVTLTGLPHGGPRSASTAIYFLLPAGTFSAFHRVVSDEAWHVYDGDPLELFVLHESGALERLVLGRDIAGGERPQAVVPAGAWQAARPLGSRYTLVGCTVSPGFDFADFTLAESDDLAARFPAHEALVRELTRSSSR